MSLKNKVLATQKLMKENPDKVAMSLEDRLIKEKEEIEFKKEQARIEKEERESNQSFRPLLREAT